MVLFCKLGCYEEVIVFVDEMLLMDIVDFGVRYEKFMNLEVMGKSEDVCLVRLEFCWLLRDDVYNYLNLVWDYVGSGLYEEVFCLLEEICFIQSGMMYFMVYYIFVYVYDKMGFMDKVEYECYFGGVVVLDYCFLNSLFDLCVLFYIVYKNLFDSKVYYYLGNLYYDKK